MEKEKNWLEILIDQHLEQFGKVNFYPMKYNSQWHVTIREGNIQYRVYPYHRRQDCIQECRNLNRRYNA